MKYNELVREFKVDMTTGEYVNNINKFGEVHPKQKKFIETITNEIYKNKEENDIKVIPSRCGIGKSTAIKSILHNLVSECCFGKPNPKNYKGYGAIFITDSVRGLEDVYSYKNLNQYTYLLKYDGDNIESLNKKSFKEQIQDQYKFPIIMITTQRYFKMTQEERNILYKWAYGTREVCIFDEKPYLTETIEVSEEYLANIRISLEKIRKCEDKTKILDSWKKIYDDLDYIRDNMSEKYNTMWFKNSKNTLLFNVDEDKKFFNLLEKYVTSKIFDDVVKLKDIYSNGCLFISSNNIDTDNSRKFVLINDNMDKFDLNKCQYYIFDATAKFDIDYTIDDSINYLNIDDKKDKKDIMVTLIPYSTSQKRLKESDGEYSHINTICKWIKTIKDDVLVECNRGSNGIIYNRFLKELNNVEYFGNIKGKNNYAEFNNCVQVGFNRASDVVYLETFIALTNKGKEWNTMEESSIDKEIEVLLSTEKGKFKSVMMLGIFRSKCIVDTVQNIMRIKCRNFSNTEPCNIYIITNDNYKDIVLRIVDIIGADFKTELPHIFEESKIMSRKPIEGKELTNPQKIAKYIGGLEKGTIIKTKDIYNATGLNNKQFEKAKKNDMISKWFTEHTVKKGQYII